MDVEIAAESDKALGLCGAKVECPDAVERVQLGVQQVAAVLGREQLALVGERKVVERVVIMIAQEEIAQI